MVYVGAEKAFIKHIIRGLYTLNVCRRVDIFYDSYQTRTTRSLNDASSELYKPRYRVLYTHFFIHFLRAIQSHKASARLKYHVK